MGVLRRGPQKSFSVGARESVSDAPVGRSAGGASGVTVAEGRVMSAFSEEMISGVLSMDGAGDEGGVLSTLTMGPTGGGSLTTPGTGFEGVSSEVGISPGSTWWLA